MTHSIRIAGLAGSLREGSYTGSAVEQALLGAAAAGAETRLIRLSDYELPFCTRVESDAECPPEVLRLRNDLRWADGIILGTPEYHGGVSGVLKNAIDLMGAKEFEGKAVGLVGVSGGALGGLEALGTLRSVGRTLHAIVIPDQVAIPAAWKVFDANGMVLDASLEKRLKGLGQETVRFARLLQSAGAAVLAA
jgi:NAD(P)H-dependent FMN reductase